MLMADLTFRAAAISHLKTTGTFRQLLLQSRSLPCAADLFRLHGLKPEHLFQ